MKIEFVGRELYGGVELFWGIGLDWMVWYVGML